MKIKKTIFKGCSVKETDFSGADLSGVSFAGCDLDRAVFVDTIIENADLRSAINYSFDPEMNKVKGAKFSITGIAGLLTKYKIDIY
jgi:uncharacterized protein YjbI with pentapeptide repeats